MQCYSSPDKAFVLVANIQYYHREGEIEKASLVILNCRNEFIFPILFHVPNTSLTTALSSKQ